MAKIRGLIFDLDGTIIDNTDAYMERMLQQTGREVGRDLGLRHAEELWYSIGAGSRDEVIVRWGLDPDRFWKAFNRHESLEQKLRNTYLHQDARFLKGLQIPRGIVTHTTLDHTIRLLEQVDMAGQFDPIISCTEDTGFKPSPLPIIYCVVAMKLGFGEVLFVGDTASDMQAARDAGVRCAYIDRYGRPLGIKPDYTIRRLEQLLEIVQP